METTRVLVSGESRIVWWIGAVVQSGYFGGRWDVGQISPSLLPWICRLCNASPILMDVKQFYLVQRTRFIDHFGKCCSTYHKVSTKAITCHISLHHSNQQNSRVRASDIRVFLQNIERLKMLDSDHVASSYFVELSGRIQVCLRLFSRKTREKVI